MASGEAGGKKRKASATSPARREPRRGLGVAELERIRVALEMAERCYAAASAPHQPPPALPPATMVVHAAGVAAAPAHHHHQHQHQHQHYKKFHVGDGAVHQQLQMTKGYLTPYYLAQHYYGNDSLTRLFTTNGGHHSSHQNHHSFHQNHYRQVDQIQSAVTALPIMGQAASSESSSSASQLQGHRRVHAKPCQTTAPPQVAFVDLVDSDDDNGDDVDELDLELKL